MRYVDEFRQPELIGKACEELHRLSDPARRYRVMEVCGGHTHAIYRFGLVELLPRNIELIHGPGCPVCVLPMGRIDDGMSIAREPGVILATFGDMLRVPGTFGSPLEHQARGVDIRTVYSPLDALKLASSNPDRRVVFFAIGFETTAPSTARTLQLAMKRGVTNFSVFCNHIAIIPALRAIIESPDLEVDAFIGPGHVSTVIGSRPYEWIATDRRRPVVISGFEPVDILQSLVMILRQFREDRCEVENQYKRAVTAEGNTTALQAMQEAFQLRPEFEWRGLGMLPASGFEIREEFADWDAERIYSIQGERTSDPPASQCGDVLKGICKPEQCRLFGTECTPERPVGALMVSSEGACAAFYNFEHRKLAPAMSYT